MTAMLTRSKTVHLRARLPSLDSALDVIDAFHEAKTLQEDAVVDYLARACVDNDDVTAAVFAAAQTGDVAMVRYLQASHPTHNLVPMILNGACVSGAVEVLADVLTRQQQRVSDSVLSMALYTAALAGHGSVIEALRAYGACDWDAGYVGARRGGHHQLAQLFISYGASAEHATAMARTKFFY